MRALLILILIYTCLADDSSHYPTNHPGVCNILAFVSDHVDEVVHVAHDEVEAATEKTSASHGKSLISEIEKVKREVKDMMEKAQCLASDLEKRSEQKVQDDSMKNPSATSEISQKDVEQQVEVDRPGRDVTHVIDEVAGNKEKSIKPVIQQANQPQQDVADTHVSKLTEDVTKVPDILTALKAKDIENKEKPTESPAKQLDQQALQHVAETHVARLVRDVAHILQNVPASLALQTEDEVKLKHEAEDVTQYSMENLQRVVRDVLHVLQSKGQLTDETKHISSQQSSAKVDQLLLQQHPKPVEPVELSDNASETPNDNAADVLGQVSSSKSLQRTARDVSHLFDGHATSTFFAENEVKHEVNLDHLKNDYSQTADILPEETQHVAIKSSSLYAKQLFPPTIGQHVDFQGRLKRNIIEEEVKIPIKIRQQINLDEETARKVRDVSHLFDRSSSQIQADGLPQTSEGTYQYVAAVDENVADHQAPKFETLRRKRNIEVGRKIAAFTVKEQNNVFKKKSKRSPDDSQEFSDTNLESNKDSKNESGTSMETESNKYIQIIKSRPARYAIEPIVKLKAGRTQSNSDDMSSQHFANDDALNKRIVRSSEAVSDSSISTSTQMPTELSQEDIQQLIKPTVKVQHRALPLTQFARRNTFRKN